MSVHRLKGREREGEEKKKRREEEWVRKEETWGLEQRSARDRDREGANMGRPREQQCNRADRTSERYKGARGGERKRAD